MTTHDSPRTFDCAVIGGGIHGTHPVQRLLKRTVMALVVLVGISLATFGMIFFTPGDPAETVLREQLEGDPSDEQVAQFRAEHGLDDPVPVQYLTWLTNALQGDLGESYYHDRTVSELIADADTAFGNCWMCCHNCAQEVKVTDDGTVVGITGVDGNPPGSAGPGSEGTLCPKGLAQLDKTHDPERIKQPYVRIDGELREASFGRQLIQEFEDRYGDRTGQSPRIEG